MYDLTAGAREQLVDLSGDGHAADDVAPDPAPGADDRGGDAGAGPGSFAQREMTGGAPGHRTV